MVTVFPDTVSITSNISNTITLAPVLTSILTISICERLLRTAKGQD